MEVFKNYQDVNGLFYIKNYLTDEESDELESAIKRIKFTPISSTVNSRCVAHYGYYYAYNRSGLTIAPPIPAGLAQLVDPEILNPLINEELPPFDQLIINEYKPGQKIAYHTDHVEQFGPIIACVTVGQSIPIHFKHGNHITTLDIEPGSMYIMTGDARYKYQHGLQNNTDGVRYSLTFRTINN